jgi:hypothetical protein
VKAQFRSIPAARSYFILVLLLATGCSPDQQVNTLTGFAQRGEHALAELTDHEGRAWKVGSMRSNGVTVYFVINSNNRVDVLAGVFDGSKGKHAVVWVDTQTRNEALAVLDKTFLSRVSNPSPAYTTWLEEIAIFTNGTVASTRTIEMPEGVLGPADVRIDADKIVARMRHFDCFCQAENDTSSPCRGLASDVKKCSNKLCDLANCLVDVINGEATNCGAEADAAKAMCAAANLD